MSTELDDEIQKFLSELQHRVKLTAKAAGKTEKEASAIKWDFFNFHKDERDPQKLMALAAQFCQHKGLPPPEMPTAPGQQRDSPTMEIARKNFAQPDLLIKILEQLSERHLHDDRAKMTVFIVMLTGYHKDHRWHKSVALKGERSAGKDNLIDTCLEHFPSDDWLKLTSATQAVLEDDISKFKIIGLSEINLEHDDRGANAKVKELIKQITEGGVSSFKKNVLTGFKTVLHSKQEQKTVIYSTTETADDNELSTRFMIITVDANSDKIMAVNSDTLLQFQGIKKREAGSWIANGISSLTQYDVVLPYLENVKPQDFDSQDGRSMRDIKRLFAVAAGIAWLYQYQRHKDEHNRIVSEPFDLLAALIITGPYFNYTYEGLGDQRLQKTMNAIAAIAHIQDYGGEVKEVFIRHELQKKMGVSVNTIKSYLKGIMNLSMVSYLGKEGNKILYERCQKGVKKVLIGVNWRQLVMRFQGVKGVKISQSAVQMLEKLEDMLLLHEKDSISEKIDTLKLTPLISSDEYTHSRLTPDIHLACYICGLTPSKAFDLKGRPLCEFCLLNQHESAEDKL